MNNSKIEWVLNPDNKTLGWTWNPLTGCLNNCPYCYARKLANGRLRSTYLQNKNITPIQTEGPGYYTSKLVEGLDPFYPRFWPERLIEPMRGKKGKGIFTCDMGELFGSWMPRGWQNEVFHIMRVTPKNRYYLLTKQPQNLVKFSPFPDNCWVGVSATNQDMYSSAVKYLKEVKAAVKFLSFEPLLERIKLESLDGIAWVIIGCQTKPNKFPELEWVRDIIEVADKAEVPVFLKDNLYPILPWEHPFIGKKYSYRKFRQEMPEVK